ncbi:MAG: DUF1749 domain-containing protein [Candidatus Micrarchaeaceae archaeon]
MLADIVSFTASDGLLLYGALYEPKAASKNAILYLHGLGGAFYGASVDKLAKSAISLGIAVFSIQQRGSYVIESFEYKGGGRKELLAGSAVERFEDSIKDIRGALEFLKSRGYTNVILAGKSTGCQKAVYYVYKSKDRSVKGIILLSPVDDYNYDLKNYGGIKEMEKRIKVAKRLSKASKGALMPSKIMSPGQRIISAERFLSTSDPARAEGRIFNYSLPKLREFSLIKVPVLVAFGSKDEYLVIPPSKALEILRANAGGSFSSFVVKGAGHSLFAGSYFPSNRICSWALSVFSSKEKK